MQALVERGVLSRVHFMSSVSGGGFAASALTWFTRSGGSGSRYDTGKHFPFPFRAEHWATQPIEHVRRHASYLEPGVALGKLSLLVVGARSVLHSLATYFMMLVVFLWLTEGLLLRTKLPLGFGLHLLAGEDWLIYDFLNINVRLAYFLAAAAVFYLLLRFLYITMRSIWYVEAGWLQTPFGLRTKVDELHPLLLASVLCLVVGTVPDIFSLAVNSEGIFDHSLQAVVPVIGVASGLLGRLFGRRPAGVSDRSILPALLIWLSGICLALSLLVLAYGAMCWLKFGSEAFSWSCCDRPLALPTQRDLSFMVKQFLPDLVVGEHWLRLLLLCVACLVIGGYNNINYVGLHRFYRDQLMKTFFPSRKDYDPARKGAEISQAAPNAPKGDTFTLLQCCRPGARGPYHLINTNIVLTGSQTPQFKARGGDAFVLSPVFCGSTATGWTSTPDWMPPRPPTRKLHFYSPMGPLSLATAMAISGAALNPRTGADGRGVTKSGMLSFVLTLLNIRLGYWVPNPNLKSDEHRKTFRAKVIKSLLPNFFYPGLGQGVLALGVNENAPWVELTDGGHFDNIGLYELVRRRVVNIIVVDGTADPKQSFESFANAVERVRNDFGVEFRFRGEKYDFDELMPGTATPSTPITHRYQLAERGFAIGKVLYPEKRENGRVVSRRKRGTIFYVNTILTEDLPANLYSYRAAHANFPDEPTLDQFFDEQQFEAYRELGYQISKDMLKHTAATRKYARALGLKRKKLRVRR